MNKTIKARLLDPHATARQVLVENYIQPEGVTKRVLKAFLKVPRHEFVSDEFKEQAYVDDALPIGEGQVITQPSLVAKMTQALHLKGKEKVLEIGTGSGYQTAILAELAKEVFTFEIKESLAVKAKSRLDRLDYKNVHVIFGDGTIGLPDEAPFEAILVTAGGPRIPPPLIDQLKEGGHLVIPLGKNPLEQDLLEFKKVEGILQFKNMGPVSFVPLTGKYA